MTSLPACGLHNSILDRELREAGEADAVSAINFMETTAVVRRERDDPTAYFVTVRMHWSGDKLWYLTTRRDRTRPRLFRDLARLNSIVRETAKTATVTLHRDVDLPERDVEADTEGHDHKPGFSASA